MLHLLTSILVISTAITVKCLCLVSRINSSSSSSTDKYRDTYAYRDVYMCAYTTKHYSSVCVDNRQGVLLHDVYVNVCAGASVSLLLCVVVIVVAGVVVGAIHL